MTAELTFEGAKMPFIDILSSYILNLVLGAWLQILAGLC